jgi:hypothetical protein
MISFSASGVFNMSADNENTIREIIYKAEPVQDPLKELVQRTESDPGAPFEPEMIQLIAELRKDDPAEYFRLRHKLKKSGVLVRELDAAISGRSDVTGAVGTGSTQTEILLRLAEDAELFHTPENARVPTQESFEFGAAIFAQQATATLVGFEYGPEGG